MAWNAPSGLSNCLRSLAYSTVISSGTLGMPPMAWAASNVMPASCITRSCQVAQPVPGSPMRSARGHAHVRRRSTWYWVSAGQALLLLELTRRRCLRIHQQQLDAVVPARQHQQPGCAAGEEHVALQLPLST